MLLKDKEINKDKTEFDSYFSPRNPVNREAARERNLIYTEKMSCLFSVSKKRTKHHFFDNERKGFYIDEDGCLIRDRFGQEL
ncbi:MAG: hypothetical protein WC584_02695 [Candidatus Pacearchaeota archaeon]